LFAMGALDDWTPVSQCQAVIGRIAQGRDLVETHIYEGAHHSFDASRGSAIAASPAAAAARTTALTRRRGRRS
jgi:dienelactone hydrolase